MRRSQHEFALGPADGHGSAPDRTLTVLAYGHYGRPVLVFPTDAGRAWDFEDHGMVAAVTDLIDAGRVKLYCVDSVDDWSWSDRTVSIEERARRHAVYQRWLLDQVVPFIHHDTGLAELITVGCSLGAYHAVQFALQRADLAPLAIGLSGNYDVRTWHAWGDTADATYFANPTDYVPRLHGDHLDWLRSRLSVVLTVGQGAWETHPTGALPSSVRMAGLLEGRGLRCELDLWGYDMSHDWEWWQRQLAHHLPRFC